jgi:putative salt-induced outer membrane protein YdiY
MKHLAISVKTISTVRYVALGLLALLVTNPVISGAAHAQGLIASAPSTDIPDAPALPAADSTAKDPAAWDRSLTLSGSYTDGNSNTALANIALKVGRDYQDNVWAFSADYGYANSADSPENSREETQNDVRLEGSYRRLLHERVYLGLGQAFLHDDIADIKYRTKTNPAVGYYLIRDDKVNLSAEVGPSYVFEKLGDEENDYVAPRLANRFEWKLSQTSKIFQSTEYLFEASDTDNYLLNGEAGIEAMVNSLLSLVVVVRNAYQNVPAEGKERNDIAVLTGIKVNL